MILHLIDGLSPGGSETMLVTLVRGLKARGEHVGVCVTRSAVDLADGLPSDVPLCVLGRTRRWDWRAMIAFGAWCSFHGVALVHAHGRSSTLFAWFARCARLLRAPIVSHDHYSRIDSGAQLLRLASHFHIDAYICVSPRLAEWARRVLPIPTDRIRLVPNSVDSSYWIPREQAGAAPRESSHGVLVAVVLANLRAEKDHPLLLRAFAASASLRRRLRLVFIGSGTESSYGKRVQRLTRELGLSHSVEILGSRRDVRELISGADFGIIASKHEAGPVASLEYMAMGLPFVSTRTGHVVADAEPAGACFAVPPGDDVQMRAALERIVGLTPEQRKQMGRRGRALVGALYASELQLDCIMTLYEMVGYRTAHAEHGMPRSASLK